MPLLNKPTAPAIPNGPVSYYQQFMDQYSRILRLYFNLLDAVFQRLLGTRGGQYLDFPYAAIQRTTDLTFTANTATQITFDQNDFLNGCTNDGTDGIHVEQTGVYNYQFSIQFRNSDTQIHGAWVWLRINGVDAPGTGSKFDVSGKHGVIDGFIIGACNFYVQLETGDTVEMWAAVEDVAVTFDATSAQTSPFAMPAIPSVVATLSFVSSVG